MTPAMVWICIVIGFLIMVGIFCVNGSLQEIRNLMQKRLTRKGPAVSPTMRRIMSRGRPPEEEPLPKHLADELDDSGEAPPRFGHPHA